MKKEHKGYIVITDCIMGDWSEFYIFLKDFRPTHIEFRHWENDLWYFYGVSELFDDIIEGEAVPQYSLIFTKDYKNKMSYEFIRMNP